MSWTIKGEAGASLDATVRTLTSLNVDSARLKLQSLAPDTFEWSVATDGPSAPGVIVPDAGQLIEVYHDGVRRFRGHVTIPRVTNHRVVIKAEGPWWWMTRTALTQMQADDEAVTAERPSYVFPTQDLKTSIEALIDRAIANGVPMTRGTVATMFVFSQITIAEKSCAQALAELMSICPDSVAYFDYSGGGLPSLNVTRRGVMTDTTLTHGTDAIEEADISPRLDLIVAQIKIGSVTREATTGANQWATQTAGTSTPGRNQIMVTSGPEVNDFLPKDRFDQVAIQSEVMPTSGTLFGSVSSSASPTYSAASGTIPDWIKYNNPTAIKLASVHGWGSIFVWAGGRHVFTPSTSGSGGTGTITGRPELYAKVSTAGKYLVVSAGNIPAWVETDNGATVDDAILDAYFSIWESGSTGWPAQPAWWDMAAELGGGMHRGWIFSGGGYSTFFVSAAFWRVSLPVKIISWHIPSLTTIYRQWDYDYINPPAGLAANLLAAQNWLPHEGQITTVADDLDGAQDLIRRWNIGGGLSSHAAMGALPKSIQYDILRGRKTIDLGSPARLDFGTLASRFRGRKKDNLIYI